MTFMHTRAEEERAALQADRTRSQRPASAGLIYAHTRVKYTKCNRAAAFAAALF